MRQPEAAAASGLNPDTFLYVEENHPAVVDGKFAAASRTVRMPLREAAARMVKNTSGEGGVYVQAELSEALAREAGLGMMGTRSASAAGARKNNGDDDEKDDETTSRSNSEEDSECPDDEMEMEPWRTMSAAGWSETQSPRMWLSAAGAVSPLHYDHSVSVLAQVHGVKRMLLYPPSTLSRAHIYPNWHPLRRRARWGRGRGRDRVRVRVLRVHFRYPARIDGACLHSSVSVCLILFSSYTA